MTPGRKRPDITMAVLKLIEKEIPTVEIAKQLGCHKSTPNYWRDIINRDGFDVVQQRIQAADKITKQRKRKTKPQNTGTYYPGHEVGSTQWVFRQNKEVRVYLRATLRFARETLGFIEQVYPFSPWTACSNPGTSGYGTVAEWLAERGDCSQDEMTVVFQRLLELIREETYGDDRTEPRD